MVTRVIQTQAALVIEQDFILQIRRLQRQEERSGVLNLLLTDVPAIAVDDTVLQAVHDKLQALASKSGGSLYVMTNGDVFIVLPMTVLGDAATYSGALLQAVLPAGSEVSSKLVEFYTMPADYVRLRERVNHYIGVAKDIVSNKADDPERNLQAAAVQGPLTAYALSQIERLLDDVEIGKYARSQRVMEKQTGGWSLYYEENYISVTELQREKFPRLDIIPSSRLLAELGAQLDRRMLAHMLGSDAWLGQKVGFNLSARTVLSSTFAQFCHVVHDRAKRANVTFEVNISDLFHDMPTFDDALATLRQEGFRVAIENIHPSMLPLLNLGTLAVDVFKVKAYKDLLPYYNQPAILQALRTLPADKLVLNRVDTQQALDIGLGLGITRFQGFHIDQNAK